MSTTCVCFSGPFARGSLPARRPPRQLFVNVHVAFHIDLAFTDEGDSEILEKAFVTAEEAPHHTDAFALCINKMKEVIIEDKTQKAR